MDRAEIRRRERAMGQHRSRGKRGRRDHRARVAREEFPELLEAGFVVASPKPDRRPVDLSVLPAGVLAEAARRAREAIRR